MSDINVTELTNLSDDINEIGNDLNELHDEAAHLEVCVRKFGDIYEKTMNQMRITKRALRNMADKM